MKWTVVGAVLYGWREPGGRLLCLYLAYLVVALLVVPTKLRFAMPLVPVMCVFAGMAVGGLWDRLANRIRGMPEAG